MKTTIKLLSSLLIIHLFFFKIAAAQNLVLNGDFETHNGCPYGRAELSKATYWHSPNAATPDYFSNCAGPSSPVMGIPQNVEGYQPSHSGDYYAGIIIQQPNLVWNEYLTGELSGPLIAGKCYRFSMYVNRSDQSMYKSDDVGVWFSQVMPSASGYGPLGPTATISNSPGIYPDNTNWALVTGDFIALGGEKYITVGNFKNSANTTLMPTGQGAFPYAFFYVDDVSVTACPHSCTASSYSPVRVCESALPYIWNGNSYPEPGIYSATFLTAAGCDSVAMLDLTLFPHTIVTNSSATVCSSQLPYVWNGNNYNTTGTYYDTLTNIWGCDSVLLLNLIVKQSASSDTSVNLCTSALPYTWNGNSYNTTGTYQFVSTASNGCDSIATLNLFQLLSSSSISSQSICSSALPYTWNGNSYNASGIYHDTLVNTIGCDSIATLNLLILPVSSDTTNESVCSSLLPYTWNGNSYNNSGTYVVTLINSLGCDSITTLHLNVLPSGSSITNVSVCSSTLPYAWNGQEYNTAGNYSILLTAANGCDSIASLNLIINPTPQVNLGNDTTVCLGKTLTLNAYMPSASYLWQNGSINSDYSVTNEGTYWVKLVLNNCENSDTINVDFKDCDCIPSIPNAFTPNGDGINDQWIITHSFCRAPIAVWVYNRYGSLVYHSDNYKNDWRGTYGSRNCPDGTYYYIIKLVYPHKEQVIKGNLTILR